MVTQRKGLLSGVTAAGGLVLGTAALLVFSRPVQESLRGSLLRCLTVLAPSLFPFLFLSCWAVRADAGRLIGRMIGPLFRRLFRLPEACCAPVLLSFFSGYPSGAKSAALLLERGQINREQAGRMLLFCVCPGPAFAVGYLGTVSGSPALGWLLFGCTAASGLLLGMLCAIGKELPPPSPAVKEQAPQAALVPAVADAGRSMLGMCGCIVLFSGLTAILRETGLFALLRGLLDALLPLNAGESAVVLSFLLEVTDGAGAALQLLKGNWAPAAFGLAFGGLCVHLQLLSFFREGPPVGRGNFFLFRLLHGLFSALLFRLSAPLLPKDALPAAAPVNSVSLLRSGSLAGGLSLVVLCGLFLLLVGEQGALAKKEEVC